MIENKSDKINLQKEKKEVEVFISGDGAIRNRQRASCGKLFWCVVEHTKSPEAGRLG